MPIYAYRCEACGFAKDVLQKLSDAVLTDCPSCSQATFKKQVTAAGFQLKGSGWYVTDFRNGSGGKAAPATGAKEGGESAPESAAAGTAESPATAGAPAAAASAAVPASNTASGNNAPSTP